MKILITYIAIVSVFLVSTADAKRANEPNDIATMLSTLMSQVRNKEQPRSYISDAQLKTADPQQVLALLAPYEKDPVWAVRRMAYLCEVRLARLQPKPEVRQEVVRRLVEGLVTGSSKHATKWLLSFTEQDFNEASKTMIRDAMAGAHPSRDEVLICGVANIQEELPRLKKMLIDEFEYQAKADKAGEKKWYYTRGWAARLARARMGITEDIKKCIELAEEEENLHYRVTVLLHDIGYIRQPAALKHLQKYLESDERLSPVKAHAPGEPVASYVMNILAESLRNYPVEKREERGYKPEEIDLCRKWMAEQTEWKIIR